MTIHAIGMFPDQVATVVSLVAVASPLGGTIGHTMMSTVFNNVVGLGSADDLMSDVGHFGDLPADELAVVVHGIKVRVPSSLEKPGVTNTEWIDGRRVGVRRVSAFLDLCKCSTRQPPVCRCANCPERRASSPASSSEP